MEPAGVAIGLLVMDMLMLTFGMVKAVTTTTMAQVTLNKGKYEYTTF
jgi:hypothetical protein